MALVVLGAVGCDTPIGADRTTSRQAYRQIHDNVVSHAVPSRDTRVVLHRFEQEEVFEKSPETTLRLLHEQAVLRKERGMLFALAELNYLAGERLRRNMVKPWDARDPRDFYLASAVYAWWFLFGDSPAPPPLSFDERFRTACDVYNRGLGWALTGWRSTNAHAFVAGGERRLPVGSLRLELKLDGFPWALREFDHFAVADQFVVRGLSVRNRQPGLGAPLVAVTKPQAIKGVPRAVPATIFLRLDSSLAELGQKPLRGSLELYSTFETDSVRLGEKSVPLETDTTVSTAYALNQSSVWKLGMSQFLSGEEKVPSDVYLTQPYRPGRVPVVFVHGTFSSPVWWAEMFNTLSADAELRRRYQFWYFIYNSGNPTPYSACRLRESLRVKLKELDPEGKDAALQQMVVIGHSQGGLLTKLTATDTGDQLLQVLLGTNVTKTAKLSAKKQALLREYLCYDALPFVKRVIFVSTPHRGSYLAGNFARNLTRRLVTLPTSVVKRAGELTGLRDDLGIPLQLRRLPTSLDSMSPKNPLFLALADIPLAPGVKGHSIIAVQGDGDYHKGRDGLVSYESAHLDYVESEFVVRSVHSCQGKPPTIDEVRRILHQHLTGLSVTAAQ
jgi:pimeloyl-ACP methyl ester carboxylesterase